MRAATRELLIKLFLSDLRSSSASPSSKFGRNSRGQAIMEYMLVLVVVVGIALGILYQLNTAFKKYVTSYFGEYIACLLETGELPSLGGDSGAEGVCSTAFEPFSLANGRPLIDAGGAGAGGAGSGSGRTGRSSGSGSRSRNNSQNLTTPNQAALNADRARRSGAGIGQQVTLNRPQESKDTPASTRVNVRRIRARRDGAVFLTGRFKNEEEKKEDAKLAVKKGKSGKAGYSSSRKLAINRALFNRKVATADTELGLSFGDYIRYLLIIGILVAIIVFIGGQLNSLRKAWEKN